MQTKTIDVSTITEFTVPSESLALHRTLTTLPEIVVEIERVVAHPDERITPYFWIRGTEYAEFEATADDDPSVENLTRLDVYEDAVLYRAVWTENVETIVHAYLQAGATILEAVGQHTEWELRMRFDDRQKAGKFHRYCEDNDIAYELSRLYDPSEPGETSQFGLTPKQREALDAARRAGFYDVPPEATMTDVARALDISQQALSKRLRRAHGSLVDALFPVEQPPSGERREGI